MASLKANCQKAFTALSGTKRNRKGFAEFAGTQKAFLHGSFQNGSRMNAAYPVSYPGQSRIVLPARHMENPEKAQAKQPSGGCVGFNDAR